VRVIIAGTRRLWSISLVREAIIESGFKVTEIITGGANGIDQAADDVAVIGGYARRVFPADWDKYGKAAGSIRNREMADAGAEALIALPDIESVGTHDMIAVMRKRNLPVFIKVIA